MCVSGDPQCDHSLRLPEHATTLLLTNSCVYLLKTVSGYGRARGCGGLEAACWPLVDLPKFEGSNLAEAVWFYFPSFAGEVKTSVPCRSFTACKRSLNVTCHSPFRQNFRTFLAHSSTFRRWVLSRGDTRGDVCWRKLERLTQIAQ